MIILHKDEKKFKLGDIAVTEGINERCKTDAMFNAFVTKSFARHCNGDWGDLCDDDKGANDFALRNGDDRLFSKYNYDKDTSIYIITEWDRSYTTVLFPDEY